MPLPLSMDGQSRGEGRFDTVALDQSGVAGVGEVSSLLEPRYWCLVPVSVHTYLRHIELWNLIALSHPGQKRP